MGVGVWGAGAMKPWGQKGHGERSEWAERAGRGRGEWSEWACSGALKTRVDGRKLGPWDHGGRALGRWGHEAMEPEGHGSGQSGEQAGMH